MKAVVINEFGTADVLKMAEMPKPVAGEDQILISVKAIGINPVDTKVRAGGHLISKRLKFPAILGWDISGVVEDCGSGITKFKSGDEVFGNLGFPNLSGGYAEYVLANENEIVIKPKDVPFEEAAALPVVGLTAYQSLHDYLKIKSGESVLIQAASGGVGHLAVQLAKIAGAMVFATASGKNKDFVESLGADRFIDYTSEGFSVIAKNMDAVQDAMGGEVLYDSIRCVKQGGRVVCLPSSTKDDPKAIELARQRNVNLVWPMMYKSNEQLSLLARMMEERKLRMHVGHVFSFERMADAHRQIESHWTVGKVVVKVNG
ncbi:MAG: NADP-dependent oxidoreductase [Chitinophagaceae bacterium]|nr:NADP-dependent oxidoreductase [Chitinophagaceae bacterium]